ncbi:MAG: Hpt domain-containing protein [Flavobacteriaceae bacterium]|nr:Hpt domain-containing protein [Flavobacteriaceae bacterium]
MVKNDCFSSEIVDLSFLNEHLSFDMEQYSQMISLFLDQSKEKMVELKENVENEDFPAIKATAHFLKSSFTIMGLKSNYLLVEMETESLNGKDIEKINDLFDRVEDNYSKSIDEYKKILAAI